MNISIYIIVSSISLLLFYFFYVLFLRKEQDFRQIRWFLNSAILISLLLPFNTYSINLQSITETISINDFVFFNQENLIPGQVAAGGSGNIDFMAFIILGYVLVSLFFIARFLLSLAKIMTYLVRSERKKVDNYTIVYLDKNIVAFSFFRWIFISKSDKYKEIAQIIEHEKIHAKQYHSFDIILSEVLVAAMWFNPLSWMYKSALKQVHEFLADKGVIDSGYNRVEYQSILVNQAAEERLVAISSHFSYSLIKKRIVMMSKKKKHGGSKFKLLIILPLAALLFMGVSLRNGQLKANSEKVEQASDWDDPESVLISKDNLIKSGSITFSPDDSDFASAFRVVSFTVSTTIGVYEESYDQKNGPTFTEQQINLIKKAKPGRKVYIENIKARGPEGELRNLGSIVFRLKG